jgi:acyl-coenzyme A synthetase/AMP-(fatty) acid ligase
VHSTAGYILWASMTHEKHLCVVNRRAGVPADDVLKAQLIKHVRTPISPIASPPPLSQSH